MRRRPSSSALLAVIDQRGSFDSLGVVAFKTDNLGPRPEYKLEGTPLMVNGVLYTTMARGAQRRLDAAITSCGDYSSARVGVAAAIVGTRRVTETTDATNASYVAGYRLVARRGAAAFAFGRTSSI